MSDGDIRWDNKRYMVNYREAEGEDEPKFTIRRRFNKSNMNMYYINYEGPDIVIPSNSSKSFVIGTLSANEDAVLHIKAPSGPDWRDNPSMVVETLRMIRANPWEYPGAETKLQITYLNKTDLPNQIRPGIQAELKIYWNVGYPQLDINLYSGNVDDQEISPKEGHEK